MAGSEAHELLTIIASSRRAVLSDAERARHRPQCITIPNNRRQHSIPWRMARLLVLYPFTYYNPIGSSVAFIFTSALAIQYDVSSRHINLDEYCTAHGATSISVSSWIPCAQPRFDEFASCIVGPWIYESQ